MRVEELLLVEDKIAVLLSELITSPNLFSHVIEYPRVPKSTTVVSTVAEQVTMTLSTPPATSGPEETETDTSGVDTANKESKN